LPWIGLGNVIEQAASYAAGQSMPTLTINGTRVEASDGQTVLEAGESIGVTIPTLCHHKDLSPVGSCRLCVVEVEGAEQPAAACTMPATEGLVVRTESAELTAMRRFVLEMLLDNYHDVGYASPDRPDNELMHWVRHYGLPLPDPSQSRTAPRYAVGSDPNPFVWVDLNKCILCTRCIRACDEIQGRFVWSVGYRGHDAKIIAGTDTTMLEGRCESCGACAAYCPTGALDDRMSLDVGVADRLVTTTCPYCGVGCQFDLNVKAGQIVRVTSNPAAPVNGMSLCVKGRYGYGFVHHDDRVTTPRVRRYVLESRPKLADLASRGPWVDVDWNTALDICADRLASAVQNEGGDAVGLLASAKCTNEENYLVQKLARQVLGTQNVDHCARLCHSSTVAGLAMCFGSGAMSNSMDDIAHHAAAALIIGSNTTEQHPVFGAMLRQAVLRRGMKIVLADPRRIDIAEFAALHLRHRPGTDVALVNGLMHAIVEADKHDQAFIDERCEGFDEFRASLGPYSPDRVAAITGVSTEKIVAAAHLLADHRPMAVIWAMGITQHTTGVFNVLALGNLQMLLGNMGMPGGGVNPLRGQNNVQGACDMGALPNVYPGYQSVADEGVAATFASVWSCDGPDVELPREPGLTVTEIIEQAGAGKIAALYILGEDPAMTDPDVNHARACLAAAPFVVLQEILESETAPFADVLLPGASFAEKEGTYTNTERRVQLIRKAIEPPGESRPDWETIADLARRVLSRLGRTPSGQQARWEYRSASAIMDEIAALTPSYAGVNHARLDRGDRLQWPVPSADHPGTPILHVGRFTRGKGKFHRVEHVDAKELPDDDFPLLLTTGRVLYHWHGGELTRRSPALLEAVPESLLEIHPSDAARFAVRDGQMLRVTSRRGRMQARAVVTDRVAEGIVFGNFHFPGEANVNNLTIAALDPIAKIPEYKVCAVAVAGEAASEELIRKPSGTGSFC